MSDRILHTGLYSKEAASIFKNFFAIQKSSVEHYSRKWRNWNSVDVEIAPDNEVLLKCSHEYGTIWRRNSGNDAKPKEWLAIKMKEFIYRTFGTDGAWYRSNDRELNAFQCEGQSFIPTIADVYFIYDTLLNRKNKERRYDDEVVKRMVGEKNDPIATELEIARRDEIKRINEKYEMDVNTAYNEKSQKIDDFRSKQLAAFEDYKAGLIVVYEAAITEAKKAKEEALAALASTLAA